MVARSSLRALRPATAERLVGLIVRVSTDMQVRNPEGSLTTQLQRLRQQVAFKQANSETDWTEVAVYELRAVSGKDSVRSPEFERLYEDIRAGRVNTVMFTALSRLCRSVKDFLGFVEFLETHGANFISLKEDYDTTTAQGRLIITIMMALAEFEREQTGERTRDAFQARTERGLWNGGRILGYDLDPLRKGYLVPNEDETVIVAFAFSTYLACGSVVETAAAMTSMGFRTKSYTSRRQVDHQPRAFSYTTVKHILKNPSYVAKKLVIDETGERLVDAVWPAIIDAETFAQAQELMARNARAHRNGAATVRHAHILSKGLLHCGRCDGRMLGRSGTGRGGAVYFYYGCANADCGLRVAAAEIEGAVIERFAVLASDDALVERLVAATNARGQRELTKLERQKRAQERALAAVKAEAARLFAAKDSPELASGRGFVADHLAGLSQRRDEVERSLLETERQVVARRRGIVGTEPVRAGLMNFARVYEHLKPFEQQELIRLVLHRAEVGDHEIVLELYQEACASFAQASKSVSRFEPTIWLPDEDSNLEHRG